MTSKKVSRLWIELSILSLILSLAAYVRLAHNAPNPGWYTDEGTHLVIAQNLTQGQVRYLAITQSTLLFAKLPLFEMLLALSLRIWGGGMGTLRTLTGALGTLSVAVLYGGVRYIKKDPLLALTAALMLALYPQAILYSRFGFSYNLLTSLVLWLYVCLWAYLDAETVGRRRRWLLGAAFALGLGGLADLWMFTLVPVFLIVVSLRSWRDALWSIPVLMLPFGLYALWMLARAPQAFAFDLAFTLSRLSGLSLWAQLSKLALNYAVLISQDHWTVLALVGLFWLRPTHLRYLTLLMFLSPIVVLGRSEALFNLSAYYTIPLLPFVALGTAITLKKGFTYLIPAFTSAWLALWQCWAWDTYIASRNLEKLAQVAAYGSLLALVVSPFITSIARSFRQTQIGFETIIDPFLISPSDARQVADFVNARAVPGDVIIASPALAWLIKGQVADFQMVAANAGLATPHLPPNVPPERWTFEPTYEGARFIVVDNLWYTWARWNVEGVTEVLHQLGACTPVFQSGDIAVYENFTAVYRPRRTTLPEELVVASTVGFPK